MNYSHWSSLITRSLCSKWKANNSNEHLRFLDNNVNQYYGKILLFHFGLPIKKIIPGYVGNQKDKLTQYGHINVANNLVRISTCLDIKNSIQFPIEELQYFTDKSFTFFTCGDLFLITKNNDIKNLIEDKKIYNQKTKLKNYELLISDLFNLNCIEQYGIIDMLSLDIESYGNKDVNYNLNSVNIDAHFLKTKLRGCLTSTKPKYIAARIENSDVKDYFEYKLYMRRADILKEFPKGPKTVQGVGYIVKNNTFNLDKERYASLGIIYKGKNASYIIAKYNDNIEQLRLACKSLIIKTSKIKEWGIHWAVKHAKYCRSNEEYRYYKQLFVEFNGIKDKYSEEEIKFFKDCCQCKPFKYNKNITYKYYVN